jgi:hypothetical protein
MIKKAYGENASGSIFRIAFGILLWSAIIPSAMAATVSINPTQGIVGTTINAIGTGWSTHPVVVDILWDGKWYNETNTDSTGNSFTATFQVPLDATVGVHTIRFNSGNPYYDVQFTVTSPPTPVPTSLTVDKVWTMDGNNKDKTSFAPGDTIHYGAVVNNKGSSTLTATINFLANGPKQIYSWTGQAPVASGSPSFYTPSTIPVNAPAGTYTLTVTVTYNGKSSSKQSQFTVQAKPTVSITADPNAHDGNIGKSFTFTANPVGSWGNNIQYSWSIANDKTNPKCPKDSKAKGKTISASTACTGTHTISVTAKDEKGNVASNSYSVTVPYSSQRELRRNQLQNQLQGEIISYFLEGNYQESARRFFEQAKCGISIGSFIIQVVNTGIVNPSPGVSKCFNSIFIPQPSIPQTPEQKVTAERIKQIMSDLVKEGYLKEEAAKEWGAVFNLK